ncbi:MAG: methylenetetrahydrofolate reductase C-terminal domain-containing protein, partial [Mycobacteriales bacterium]
MAIPRHPDRAGAAPERRHAGWPMPVTPSLSARTLYRLHHLLEPNLVYRRIAAWLEWHPRANRLFTAAEERVKGATFGCRMCGQCALPATGYACPMTCPKQL